MLTRPLARAMLASWFATQGVEAARHPAPHLERARPALDAAMTRAESLSGAVLVGRVDDKHLRTAVQVHGALTALAACALAFGKAPRTAALALAVLTAPLALTSLPVSKSTEPDPELRRERRDRFVRAVSFTGAAVLAGVDREGRPGLSWRIQHARAERAQAHESS